MKLTIGENIKFFRKSKDITQEELSEMLGVSCQSVSRWETSVCYPDMELLPAIAEIFQISVDKLLGIDDAMEQKKVQGYLDRFQKAVSCGNISDCISIAREGVSEYPNNYTLLNKLMYALFLSGDEDGNISDWKENQKKYDKEIVTLGERIMKYCPDQNIRLEATGRLAFHHCEMGRKDLGRSIYETLPSQELCRENQIWWGLDEPEKLPFLRKKIRQDYGNLRASIWKLACSGLLTDQESASALEKLFDLENLLYDDAVPNDTWGTARMNCDIAQIYARLKDTDKALRHLQTASEAARSFDNRMESQRSSTLLFGTIEVNRTDFETADTRTLCEIMRDKWLSVEDFDILRQTETFQELLSSLSSD